MALFKPLYGNKSRLSFEITPFHEGYVYLCDDGSLYFDMYVGTIQKRIPIKADAETAKKLIELNKALNVSVWVGTKAEYDAITDKDDSCLYITTDDTESIQWEMLSNKVTALDDSVTDEQYPSALAVWNILSNLNQYEKTENKVTKVTSTTTDTQYPSALAVYTFVNQLFTIANENINTLNNNAEKTSNKITNLVNSHTDKQYPSAKAVYDYVENLATEIDKSLEKLVHKTSTLNSSSTNTQYPSAKAVYDYVEGSISSNVPVIHASTSEPTASDGKAGDLWVVIE